MYAGFWLDLREWRRYMLAVMKEEEETVATIYQKMLAERAPEMNALHMETLAYMVGSTLNGMPAEFFDDIASLARRLGSERLAKAHADYVI